MKKIIRASFIVLTLGILCCGTAVKDTQDFVPNKPPVLGIITQTMPDGSAVGTENIVSGMSIRVSVPGYDPEGKTLSWAVTSDAGSAKKPELTATGYSFTFVTTGVSKDKDVLLYVTATDNKHASASTSFNVGTGQTGSLVTLTHKNDSVIRSSGNAPLLFTSSAKGYFEAVCCADESLVSGSLTGRRTVYETLDENGAYAAAKIIVRGAESTATADITLPAAQGAHSVWAVFYDANGTETRVSTQISVDDSGPEILSSSPADGAITVSTSPLLHFTFSKAVNSETFAGAVKVSFTAKTLAAAAISYTSTTADFTLAQQLPLNTECTVTVSGIEDTLGNVMIEHRFTFTTAPGPVVTYDGNGAEGSPPASVSYTAGTTVTVAEQGNLSRTGYVFLGWSTDKLASEAAYEPSDASKNSFAMSNNDVTLYAVWKQLSIMITPSDISMPVGDSVTLSATYMGNNQPALFSECSVLNQDILTASITSGEDRVILTAKAKGDSTVILTAENGASLTFPVTVTSSLGLPKAVSLSLGEQTTITAATSGSVAWTTSDKEIVEISGSGSAVNLTGRKKGTACIGAFRSVNGTTLFESFPVTVTTVDAVAAGLSHTLILRSDGTVWVCGVNHIVTGTDFIPDGRLGLGKSGQYTAYTPEKVDTSAIGTIAAVGAGSCSSYIITSDHVLYSCGNNVSGQLGLGDYTSRYSFTKVMGNVQAVSGGSDHVLITTTAGEVFSCGGNNSGQLGLGDQEPRTSPVKIAGFTAGTDSYASTKVDSSLVIAGSKLYGFGLNDQYDLGLGNNTSQDSPQYIIGSTDATIVSVSAGMYFALALDTSGKLYVWGGNWLGQIGLGSTSQQKTPAQLTLPDRQTPASCAASWDHSLVVTTDGNLYSMGYNNYGQLGHGDQINRFTPQKVDRAEFNTNVGSVTAGFDNSFVTTKSGELYAFGMNEYGQLGDRTSTIRLTPQKITLPVDIIL